jgi:hypothetical protein
MPRLPSELDLGQRPVPEAAPTFAAPAGAEAPARAAEGVGNSIEEIGFTLQRARRAAVLADTLQKSQQDLDAKQIAYQRDPDFKTIPQRFKGEADQIGQSYAQQIEDPVVRQVFTREYGRFATAKQFSIMQTAAKKEGDYNVSTLDSFQEQSSLSYAAATNEMERTVIANQYKMAVGEMAHAGWITQTDAEKRMKQFAQRTDQAIAMQDINNNPNDAIQRLSDPAQYPRMDPTERERLIRAADVRLRQQQAEARLAQEQAEKDAREQLFQKLAAGRLTVRDIMNSNASPVAQEHYLEILHQRSKEALERPVRQEPSVFLNALQGIRDHTIVDETQIEKIYAESVNRGAGLTWENVKQLRTELQDARTPDGERLGKTKTEFLKGVAPQIDKSNPMMGRIDETGKQKLYEFSQALESKIMDYRKQGKNPFDLLDPSKPDYMGKPEALKPYQKTFQQSMETFSTSMRAGAAPSATAPSRLPGETPEQYLKRTGGK